MGERPRRTRRRTQREARTTNRYLGFPLAMRWIHPKIDDWQGARGAALESKVERPAKSTRQNPKGWPLAFKKVRLR
jgi:hypothetical protein